MRKRAPTKSVSRFSGSKLNPGDLMIFQDSSVQTRRYSAQPLSLGGRAKRDVLVCTVDFPMTYLQRDPLS